MINITPIIETFKKENFGSASTKCHASTRYALPRVGSVICEWKGIKR